MLPITSFNSTGQWVRQFQLAWPSLELLGLTEGGPVTLDVSLQLGRSEGHPANEPSSWVATNSVSQSHPDVYRPQLDVMMTAAYQEMLDAGYELGPDLVPVGTARTFGRYWPGANTNNITNSARPLATASVDPTQRLLIIGDGEDAYDAAVWLHARVVCSVNGGPAITLPLLPYGDHRWLTTSEAALAADPGTLFFPRFTAIDSPLIVLGDGPVGLLHPFDQDCGAETRRLHDFGLTDMVLLNLDGAISVTIRREDGLFGVLRTSDGLASLPCQINLLAGTATPLGMTGEITLVEGDTGTGSIRLDVSLTALLTPPPAVAPTPLERGIYVSDGSAVEVVPNATAVVINKLITGGVTVETADSLMGFDTVTTARTADVVVWRPGTDPSTLAPTHQYPGLAGLVGGVTYEEFIRVRGDDTPAVAVFVMGRLVRLLSTFYLIAAAWKLVTRGELMKIPKWLEFGGVTYGSVAALLR